MPGKKSYGHGAAIGVALGAGAGATAAYFGLRHHRRHQQVVGCVGPDGKTLASDDGKHNYQLVGTEQVNAGERVSIMGKKTKGATGLDELDVQSVKQHLGQCEQHAALIQETP